MSWDSQAKRADRKPLPELWEKKANVPSAKPAMTWPWEYLRLSQHKDAYYIKMYEAMKITQWHTIIKC